MQEKIRFNLQIPNKLKSSLDLAAQSQGVRTTTLVKRILEDYSKTYREKQLEQNLIEGYQYLSEEYKQICEDFKNADSEGWE